MDATQTSAGATLDAATAAELARIVGPTNIVTGRDDTLKQSKDFYWYSPVLRRLLDDKAADAIVKVADVAMLKAVVSLCARRRVPLVVRGGATGNYGQSIPLHGGVLVDLRALDAIHSVDGVAHVEPGATLGEIEQRARAIGWELRCKPSTWVKSSMGGFLCGGSGGIGSIVWGGINNGDNIKSITVLSVEEEPRLVRFEERAAITALHTYGTTGILVEIEMRLAPKRDYDQLIVSSAAWDALFDWTDAVARDGTIPKRLVTQFEWPVPDYFRPLKKHLRTGEHATFLLVDRSTTDAVVASAARAGLAVVYCKPLPDPLKPPYLTDYTWNHTTLWAIKADPSITYLQAGFGPDFRAQFRRLQERFPGEILLHLEWTAGNAKMERQASRMASGDQILVGGIPLVRFRSEERLREILDFCDTIGVFIANPHTYLLEGGGRHTDIADKRALKARFDPHGILNPGKMGTYPHNPFAGDAAT